MLAEMFESFFPSYLCSALCNFAYNESLMRNYLTQIRLTLLGQVCSLLPNYNVKGWRLKYSVNLRVLSAYKSPPSTSVFDAHCFWTVVAVGPGGFFQTESVT